MKKLYPAVCIINAVLIGVSFFVGLTVCDGYFDGNRIIGYGICLSLAAISLEFTGLLFLAVGKYLQRKTEGEQSEIKTLSKAKKIVLSFLILITVVLGLFLARGIGGVIGTGATAVLIMAICAFALACVGLFVTFYK